MEDYKKKLKDALDDKLVPVEVQEWIEENFPELVESENEMMIQYFKDLAPFDNADVLYSKYGFSHKDAIAWLEKQGEQKINDKVKPKFKVGDYVVDEDDNCAYQIECVMENVPSGEFSYDLVGGGYFPSTKKNYHLWTIQDAKDGDVLYAKSERGVEFIVMFKEFNECGSIDSYFRYNSEVGFGVNVPSVLSSKDDHITPATEDQKRLLFLKMKEAGYEWDAKKKELKKIERNPVWSEEDNEIFLHCCAAIRIADYSSIEDRNKMESWFKTLKDRIQTQPKYEWSDKDEATFTVIGSLILDNFSAEDASETLTWLHSLTPHPQWKPSDEQMEALKNALNDAIWQYDFKGSLIKEEVTRKHAETIESLYNDLKKLKG